MSLFYKTKAVKSSRELFPKIVIKNLREFPFPSEMELSLRRRLAAHVEAMLEVCLAVSHHAHDNVPVDLRRRAEAMDVELDLLAYEAYGLSPVEIALVERETGAPGGC